MTENRKHVRAIFVAVSLFLAGCAVRLAAGQTSVPAHRVTTDKIETQARYFPEFRQNPEFSR